MTERERSIAAFVAASGWSNATRQRIAGDASNRAYDRLTRPDGSTTILMDAPPERGEDVRPFMRIAKHLSSAGLSAPEIYEADAENGLLLIEDFGDTLFARLIADDPALTRPLYTAACDVLLKLRQMPPPDLAQCDAEWLTSMVDPVFGWYAGIEGADAMAQFTPLFRPLAEEAARQKPVLMLRDYHVENLILLPDRKGVRRVGILDFQDAMLAHPAYDLVSILQDARRDVDTTTERQMLDYYIGQTADAAEDFLRDYAILGLQRNLRIVGVFARLCLRDGKAHYVDMIPRVWGYVERNLAHPALAGLAPFLMGVLPKPDAANLEHLKRQCPPIPSPF